MLQSKGSQRVRDNLATKQQHLFIFGCAGSSLLRGLFSSSGEQGLLSSCGAQASHCGGFSGCTAQARALGAWAQSHSSLALEHKLSSCGTWD